MENPVANRGEPISVESPNDVPTKRNKTRRADYEDGIIRACTQ